MRAWTTAEAACACGEPGHVSWRGGGRMVAAVRIACNAIRTGDRRAMPLSRAPTVL